jgi:sugar lactone lactonase YvrE
MQESFMKKLELKIMLDAPFVDCRCQHGEGPVWDAETGRLFWVDIIGRRIFSLIPVDGSVESRSFDEGVCALAPMAEGRLFVAFAKRLAIVDWATGRILENLVDVEPDMPGNRCNDGKMDAAGRFWIGTMSRAAEKGAGSLYCYANGLLKKVLGNLTISNGMDWTPAGDRMFFIDSPTREVRAFAFDASTGGIDSPQTVVKVPADFGVPDGMCLAPDGTIWVAHWGAGCVCRWDLSNGELVEQIFTGCPQTSSCCLDPHGMLYITTSRQGMSEDALKKAPHSGSLFRCQTSRLSGAS